MKDFNDIKRVILKDNTIEYIDSHIDIIKLVEKYLGEDVSEYIKALHHAANYAERRIYTDIVSYEATLDEYDNCFIDIEDSIDRLSELVKTSKRINKQKLYDELDSIKKILKNR